MSGIVPRDAGMEASLSTTVYADDLYVWSSARSLAAVARTLTLALEHISGYLSDVGLHTATNKSCFMHFRATGLPSTVTLSINGVSIARATVHKFLGVRVHHRYRTGPQVTASLTSIKVTAAAIRRMANTRW